jgi:predicted CopG family antitoxin
VLKVEKTIKVDENTYRMLNELVGEEEKRPVSINEALSKVLKEKKKRNIMDFAGSWKMSDSEEKKMKAGLKKAWSEWKPKSF